MDLVFDTPEFSQTGNKVLELVLEIWFGETVHTCIYTYTYIYIYPHTDTHTHTHRHTHTDTDTHTHTHTHTHKDTQSHTHIYIYIYIYIYTHTHTHKVLSYRETDRHRPGTHLFNFNKIVLKFKLYNISYAYVDRTIVLGDYKR